MCGSILLADVVPALSTSSRFVIVNLGPKGLEGNRTLHREKGSKALIAMIPTIHGTTQITMRRYKCAIRDSVHSS
jgi:hypothetical protein